MKSLFENLIYLRDKFKSLGFIKSIDLIYTLIFYRLEYIENITKRKLQDWEIDDDGEEYEIENNSGYYLVKRLWLWYLLFPWIVSFQIGVAILLAVVNTIRFIHSYKSSWIQTKEKISFKQRVHYRTRLWK
ncbi:hypothetical protein [Flectobacillus sp. BAB-3569]|uniref:hypothetical protein n=1 Tax=Flectobacillus sp. BAB-3569 TaxID=1509483 RepID=UPI000BC9B659|nr:hypothetical protein [Flectobacillus sp. BAB-3569]PAC27807.1 hypothetical protein BWI92_21585 [Flectobacillus sp. BAB-3569]